VDAVIDQTGYSKQLQRAMDYDSPKALGITFVTPAIYTPSPKAAALAALPSPSCLSPRAVAPFRSSDSAAQPR
jgi:hypothetical protein